MIEVTLRKYLENNLDVPVYMEHPRDPERNFILLQIADAGRINHIDMATFFVTVYDDESFYKAAQLKEKVKDLLFNAIVLDGITKSTIGQEQAVTDSANHLYQYNLTFNFYYYREEI